MTIPLAKQIQQGALQVLPVSYLASQAKLAQDSQSKFRLNRDRTKELVALDITREKIFDRKMHGFTIKFIKESYEDIDKQLQWLKKPIENSWIYHDDGGLCNNIHQVSFNQEPETEKQILQNSIQLLGTWQTNLVGIYIFLAYPIESVSPKNLLISGGRN